jgi:tRNA nucleotidyltransferase (CCA-adding enzyme)
VAWNRTRLQVAALLPNKPKVQVFKNYGTAMLRYEDTEIECGARKVLSF